MKIRDWYIGEYPADGVDYSDTLGYEINKEATFGELYWMIQTFGDVYFYLGVYDSLLRERVFWRLSEIMEIPYEEICSQWLLANEYVHLDILSNE